MTLMNYDRSKLNISLQNKCFKKRYYLQKLLGQCLQGKVFSAYDRFTEKTVAITFIDKNDKDSNQFKREIKIYKDLDKLPSKSS